MLILGPIASMLIQMAISRSREYSADAASAKYTGHPDGLINALQKLERGSKRIPMNADPSTAHMFIIKPFTGRSLMNLFSTHPSTEQRIARLGGDAITATVRITAKGAGRIESGHPWVFASDVADRGDAAPGRRGACCRGRGRAVGVAHYSSTSQIALRLLSCAKRDGGPGVFPAPDRAGAGAPSARRARF